jgi:hypothetical protein
VNLADPSGLRAWAFGACLPTLEQISNTMAGFGDMLTFSGTKAIRQLLNIDNVDYR